jgi:hypothetical protein
MKKVLAVLVLLVSVSTAAAQIHETTYVDIGNARSVNSASIGLNLSHSSHTNIQFADDGWSASHAILFNAYRNSTNLTLIMLETIIMVQEQSCISVMVEQWIF